MGKIVNQRELAELLGVTSNTIAAWRSEGMPCLATADKKGAASRYDVEEVFAWQKARSARSGSTDDIDAKYEQARLTKAKADNEELDRALKEGSLIEAAVVEEAWTRMLGNFRARLLSLPAALADELAVIEEPREVQAVIKVYINQALDELANSDVEEICPSPEDDAEA